MYFSNWLVQFIWSSNLGLKGYYDQKSVFPFLFSIQKCGYKIVPIRNFKSKLLRDFFKRNFQLQSLSIAGTIMPAVFSSLSPFK